MLKARLIPEPLLIALILGISGCDPEAGKPGTNRSNPASTDDDAIPSGLNNDGTVTTDGAQQLADALSEDGSAAPTASTDAENNGKIDDILATWGDLHINGQAFHQKASVKRPANGHTFTLEEKREILNTMVDDLALAHAARMAGLLNQDKAKAKMVDTLITDRVLNQVDSLRYTDEQLRAWYDANREKIMHPAQVQMALITIRSSPKRSPEEAKNRIEALHRQLQTKPELFASLATQHSEDIWSRRKGVVGWVPKTGKVGIDASIIQTAFELDTGEFSAPIETASGWSIVRTNAQREAQEKDWPRSKGDVMRAIKEEKVQTVRAELVSGLREQASIEQRLPATALDLIRPLDQVDPTVVVQINDDTILQTDLSKAASHTFPPGTTYLSEAEIQHLIEQEIEFVLLVQEARRTGLATDPRVEKTLQSLLKEKVLKENQVREISDDDLLNYYQANPEEFEQNPRLQIRRIVIKINSERSRNEAESLMKSIRREVDVDAELFPVRARELSEDQYAKSGGSMGWITQRPRPGISQDTLDHLFQLKMGELSEIQVEKDRISLYQVAQKVEGKTIRFDDAEGMLRQKIKQNRQSTILEQVLADSRALYPVQINDELLDQQVVVSRPRPELHIPSQRGQSPLGGAPKR